jgi:mannose-6-phosphate isomerase-like protein (cupin superfamily)
MKKINTRDLTESSYASPKGKYASCDREISEALGREDGSTDLRKRHPFDVEICRIPAGKAMCPYHSHSAQWEFYHVLSGRGQVRHEGGLTPLEPGDAFLFGRETTGLPAWQRVQDVNLTSVYLCCRAALRHMVPAGRGSIINTASFVAVMGSATSQISYTASKGGVLAMSRELGVQFARQGIRVNALCPGPVNTALLQELFAKDPERAARRLVHIPLGRFAEPEELAAAVAFLASDDASFITASTFLVDGGISSAYVTPL